MNDKIAVMYSRTQGYFHVENVADMIQRNTELLIDLFQEDSKIWPDFCVIGIFNTGKEAHAFIQEMQEILMIEKSHGVEK